jgi:hypothetical protein
MAFNFLVANSVSASSTVARYDISTSHKKNETAAEAINIGNLDQQSTIVTISDAGQAATSAVSTTFTAKAGLVNLSESFNNFVNQVFTRFQLFDNAGTILADNQGTTEQQTAYTKWVDGSLALSAGTYTVTATPDEVIGDQYLTATSMEQQGTSLEVNSTLTGGNPSEFYKFSLSGKNIKLSFDAGSNTGDARVVLYDKNNKIVADSGGNARQKTQYHALTSGTGLSALSGDYTVKVTYADGADSTKDIKYSMNLYSGNTYAVVYKNSVAAQPYDNTASGSVTPTADALVYEKTSYNKIDASASSAIMIGWMIQDKTMLDVYSRLTSADNAEYYSFVFEQGDNLKFGFRNETTEHPSNIRVQLMDRTGLYTYADSEGTAAQQEAYRQFTTTGGLQAKTGTYVIKLSYAEGAAKNDETYEFGLYSGTGYSAKYNTTASPETFGTALLLGELSGSAAASGIAKYLTAQMNDEEGTFASTALSDALKSLY